MRKMFTRLFSLTLLMYLVSIFTVVQAQECDVNLQQANVVLVTDPASVCDGADLLYKVVGFPGAEFAFNFDGNVVGGFTPDSTVSVPEGLSFTVQVLVNDTCFSNIIEVENASIIEPVQIQETEVEHPLCYGGNGELTITFTGDHAPYKYYVVPQVKWADNAQNPILNPGLLNNYLVLSAQVVRVPGSYWVAVQEANNCVNLLDVANWDSTWINPAPSELVFADVNATADPVCIGGNGTVVVAGITGGTPFTDGNYDVTIGATTIRSDGDTAVFTLPAGSYTATVVDSFGCVATLDSVAVVTDPDEVTFEIGIKDVTCAEGATGIIYVTDFAGGSGAQYYAKVDDGPWTLAVNDTVALTGLSAGYYSVYVKQETACDSVGYENPNQTGNVVSVQAPGEITYDVDVDDIVCYGDETTITVTNVDGGSGLYEYALNGVWGSAYSWDVVAGNYTVSVRDANDATCEIEYPEFTLTNPDTVVITEVATVSTSCKDGNDGVINITATAEEGRTIQYSIDGEAWYSNNIFAVAAGTYTVYVRETVCPDDVKTAEVVVVELDDNVIAIAEEDTFINCFGTDNAYVYLETTTWADQTGSDDREITYYMTTDEDELWVSGETSEDGEFENLAPGTYYFWAGDNYGCVSENSLTVVVTEADELTMDGEVTDNATCYGDNDGVITITATGTPLKYAHANTLAALMNLSDLAYTNWPAEAESVQIQVGKGTYYVIVKDDCGEKVYDGPFVVEGLDEVTIIDTAKAVTDIRCYGDSIGVIEIYPAEGGTEEFTYTLQVYDGEGWENVEGYVGVTTTIFEGLAAGEYRVLVTDLGGCEGTKTGNIEVVGPDAPTSIWLYSYLDISCYGASNGLIQVIPAGGIEPYEYQIDDSEWRAVPTSGEWNPTLDEIIINITEAGTYEVKVRDANECESEAVTVVIEEPDPIVLTIEKDDVTTNCSEVPNGSIEITISGGNPFPHDIYVNEELAADNYMGAVYTMNNLESGNYEIKVVESSSTWTYFDPCEASASVVISSPDSLMADVVIIDSAQCFGYSNGEVLITVTGGTAPYVVEIEGVDTLDVVDGEVSFTGLAAGTYTANVVDDVTCNYVLSFTIGQPDSMTLAASWISDITCEALGSFSVTATGGSGDFKYFAALSELPDHVLIPDPLTSDEWQTENVFEVEEAGTYIVWAYDVVNGCLIGGEENELGQPVNAWRVKIQEPSIIVDFNVAQTEEIKCNGLETAEIVLSNITINSDPASLEDVTIKINDVVVSDTISSLGAGTYTIKVIDNESGCSHSETIEIEEPEALEVNLVPGEGEFTCADAIEGYIEANVSGGTPIIIGNGAESYYYQLWQDGVVKTNKVVFSKFLVTIGHDYQVVITDANGCTDTSDVITINPVAPVELLAIKDVTCSSDTLASVVVTAAGEAGREFRVHYREFENDIVVESGVSDWFTGTIKLDQVLEFDNENVEDVHYEFQVEDDMGCVSEKDTMTFDQVITSPLELVVTENTAYECSSDVTISVGGGVAPYVITIDGEPVVAGVVTLQAGTHVINTTDLHGCLVSQELVLEYETVTSEETMTVFIGDTAHFVFESIDTMLLAGTYSFEYVTEAGCTRVVNVTVNEVPKTYTIAEVQGTEDESPLAGKVAEITGTVTGVAAGQGFFVQDAVAAWSGIWVAYPSVSTAGILVGNAVKVVGDVAEVASVTTITATSVELKTSPLAITAIEVTPTEAEAEMYESVLTMVKGVRADAADANGAWNVYLQPTDNITVNDWLYAYTPVKDTYYNVTGVVNGKDNAFKLEPRMASDVVDLTSTVVNPELENTFNVYPNPFNDHITIDNNDKLTRVVVVNVAGQRVIDIEYPNREIRTANLVSGVYVISLYTEDGIAKSERIIKR